MTEGTKLAGGRGPLSGVRVVELGQLMAGPYAGTILAYFGAEVIKVEPADKGDALRVWRVMDEGTSLWWHAMSRNKKCVTANLRDERGRELVRRLAAGSDVLIENFRPGTMEKWGLGPETFEKERPGLIYVRVSGYGQSGPRSQMPGYASVCEGFGGFRYVNGFPGEPPVRPNLSLGDTLAGLHAALGVVLSLFHRQRSQGGREGQQIDVAIYEAVFQMMEAVVPEYDRCGVIRGPSGSTLTGVVPTNTYLCKDGKYVIIGGNGDSIYKRLMNAAGRPDLADDPRLAMNDGRVRHEKEIDAALEEWTRSLTSDEVMRILEQARVPNGPIYSVADMMQDTHYRSRGMFEEVEVGGKPLKLGAMVPRLSKTPGETRWGGPALGEHNEEIYTGVLGMSREELEALRSDGVI
jgi:crotonobetainyl-CoA:carnitine CoA-transferase CaiB-like acyl-CoA transferase